jgi:hypothetical protein
MKVLRLRASQRDRRAIDTKLERITAERAAQKLELRPLNEAKHHQALHRRIGSVDRIDADAVAGL